MKEPLAIIFFIIALVAAVEGIAAFLRYPKSAAQWSFLAGMLLLSLESALTGCTLKTLLPEQDVHLQNIRLLATGLLSGTWLLFSLTYARGNYRQFLSKWWPILVFAFLVPIMAILPGPEKLVIGIDRRTPPYDSYWAVTWQGRAILSTFLISAILILMQLERTLRTSVGTMRWRIKFMVVALGLLFSVRIYTASQFLLYASISPFLQEAEVIALLLTCLLLGIVFVRAGLTKADVYPSPRFIQGSAAALLAGLYLLLVGGLAQVISILGGDAAWKTFFVLASLAVLLSLLLSDRIRSYIRRYVSRNFQRPQYDYRAVWTTFAERSSFLMDRTGLCQEVVKWISETFNLLSVSIWVADEANQRLTLGASTSLPQKPTLTYLSSKDDGSELFQHLRQAVSPFDMETATEPWIASMKEATNSFFPNGGRRICVPIIGRGELVGVLTLGDRVKGESFTIEDYELLSCVSQHIASHLVNIQLSQKLLQMRELEAFQTMAAFFVHDLKNVGSTFSLMLQNLHTHFENPEFRKDALRSLSRSVEHLNNLISRLSLLRQQLTIHRVPADLNQVIATALESVKGLPTINMVRDLKPLPKIALDSDQILKVITNLLLNAIEAIGKEGEIRIETSRRNSWAVLAVRDSGPGIAPEFITHSLFRPFQTTKKKGLGIGMFHSKMIVDAHQGKIEVESLPGKGATFRILLPLSPDTL
jgi:putative PEP-CTERM system histidine kinase